MKRRYRGRVIGWLLFPLTIGLLTGAASTAAQSAESAALQIRLRYSDGAAAGGESITLRRLPEEAEPAVLSCETGADGACMWEAESGLYEILFERPLDAVSSLAVAEGGLRGFGLTVGDDPIVYHFTFQRDGRVYFDAAPEAEIPVPIIPTHDALHGGAPVDAPTTEATAVSDANDTAVADAIADTDDTAVMDDAAIVSTMAIENALLPFWRVPAFIALGLAIGGGLHLWTRKRAAARRSAALNDAVEESESEADLSSQPPTAETPDA